MTIANMSQTDFDVADYVQLVRIFLGDLESEVCEELTDGLTADLVDLVADQGANALCPTPKTMRTSSGRQPAYRPA